MGVSLMLGPRERPGVQRALVLYDAAQHTIFVVVALVTLYFFHRLIAVKKFHANFRLVLACAALSFLGLNGFRIPMEYVMARWVTSADDAAFRLCRWLSLCHMVCAGNGMLCMNMLAVEQTLATAWVKDYEATSIRVGVILMVIAVIQSISSGLFMNYYFEPKSFADIKQLNSCIPVDHHVELAWILFSGAFLSTACCSIWLCILRRYNTRRAADRLHLSTLSARYQQTENANSNRSIQPTLNGYFLTAAFGLCCTVLRQHYYNEHGVVSYQNKLLCDFGYVTMDIYALYHMFCYVYYNPAMKHVAVEDLERFTCGLIRCKSQVHAESRKLDPGIETETYFKNYAWTAA